MGAAGPDSGKNGRRRPRFCEKQAPQAQIQGKTAFRGAEGAAEKFSDPHPGSLGFQENMTLKKFPKKLSKADRDKLESIFFEEGTDGLENMGWEQVDSELLFFGKLNINKV